VVAFPAVLTAGVPWVRIVSCNPLEMKDPDLPPTFSGYPTADRSGWERFRTRYREIHAEMLRDFDEFCRDAGAPPLPIGEFMYESSWLNLYLYAGDADYERSVPLGPNWHRLDSCVRATDSPFQVPNSLRGDGSLIYLSLGSLGSADTGLMSRILDLLGRTEHRVIVSMGPRHEELRLADNMYGDEFLPQPSILPLVDLVITHGGNNTLAECLHFGKPMIVLPLFWDQYDNAQRVDELEFGIRLDSYRFSEQEFHSAMKRLLEDRDLRERLTRVTHSLQSNPGTARAANLIEMLARGQGPVARTS
jgi:UDP:flavonoid glycosyltransferase YjiC (YdhE family)